MQKEKITQTNLKLDTLLPTHNFDNWKQFIPKPLKKPVKK